MYIMNNKKIGVVTHYYKSKNYGGNLQAYGLSKLLQNLNFEVEQICIDFIMQTTNINPKKNFLERLKEKGAVAGYSVLKYFLNKIRRKKVEKNLINNNVTYRQEKAFTDFNLAVIPNSKTVYTKDTILSCIYKYEVFITGSDQVWNPGAYFSPFFLDFVPSDRPKISYAASLGTNKLTDSQKELYKEHLKDFKAISVREKDAVDLLKDITPVEPQYVVDPTLLLERGDWDKVCSERQINYKYIICYFLGDNKKARKAAQKLAKEKGLKLINIAYAGGNNAYFNIKFGDIKLYDASPQDFISLIKHAEYVFTDSFHAVVFSYIYQKQYFVFNRDKSGSMNSRIYSITELFNQTERFCFGKNREKFEYVNALNDADYSIKNEKLEQMIEKSKKFLLDNLN